MLPGGFRGIDACSHFPSPSYYPPALPQAEWVLSWLEEWLQLCDHSPLLGVIMMDPITELELWASCLEDMAAVGAGLVSYSHFCDIFHTRKTVGKPSIHWAKKKDVRCFGSTSARSLRVC